MTTSPARPLELPAVLADAAAPSLSPVLLAARAALATAAGDYLAIPDAAIEKRWLWRGHDHGDGVRYGIYRAAETVEAADAAIEGLLAGSPALADADALAGLRGAGSTTASRGGAAPRTAAEIRMAPATVARWALQGRLVALDDAILDRVPKPGEWTARETLAHIIDGQIGYGWFSRWWLSVPSGPDRPARPTPEAEAASERELPKEGSLAEGPLSRVRANLDAALDEWALRFAPLGADALAIHATWTGMALTIDFRLGRWASHIREHTIQLDKTLDWLGYAPSEPVRIVRDLFGAWGRLEARIFPRIPSGTEAEVGAVLQGMAEQLVSEARSAREAAEA